MVSSPVLLVVDDGVATITLNRPEAMNALDVDTKVALLQALREADRRADIRCVVLTGSGRAFCVGQDLREHAERLAGEEIERVWATVPEHFNPIAEALQALEKPVVAAVNGVAAGAGASIAFLADLRILSEDAGFNLAFTGVGLSCDTGSSWTLPRLVGTARAVDLLFRPRTVRAAEALDLGLATEVVPAGEFAARVATVTRELAAGPTLAYAAIRRAVTFAAGRTLSEALAFEAEMMQATGSSTDHRGAVEAFLAKRPATFTGT